MELSARAAVGEQEAVRWRTFAEDKQLLMDTELLSAGIEPATFLIKEGLYAH